MVRPQNNCRGHLKVRMQQHTVCADSSEYKLISTNYTVHPKSIFLVLAWRWTEESKTWVAWLAQTWQLEAWAQWRLWLTEDDNRMIVSLSSLRARAKAALLESETCCVASFLHSETCLCLHFLSVKFIIPYSLDGGHDWNSLRGLGHLYLYIHWGKPQ